MGGVQGVSPLAELGACWATSTEGMKWKPVLDEGKSIATPTACCRSTGKGTPGGRPESEEGVGGKELVAHPRSSYRVQ